MFGPDAASLLLSTLLIGGPAITFCNKMYLRIKETEPLYGYSVLIMGFILTVLVSIICKVLSTSGFVNVLNDY